MLLLKYLIEGAAVAVALKVIPTRKLDINEVLMVSLTAGATFLVLDMFAPSIGESARGGAGLGIGFNQVGMRFPGLEGFSSVNGDMYTVGGVPYDGNGEMHSCNACHDELGTGVKPAHGCASGCPGNLLKPPFGVDSEFRGNNIAKRNRSPGRSGGY